MHSDRESIKWWIKSQWKFTDGLPVSAGTHRTFYDLLFKTELRGLTAGARILLDFIVVMLLYGYIFVISFVPIIINKMHHIVITPNDTFRVSWNWGILS